MLTPRTLGSQHLSRGAVAIHWRRPEDGSCRTMNQGGWAWTPEALSPLGLCLHCLLHAFCSHLSASAHEGLLPAEPSPGLGPHCQGGREMRGLLCSAGWEVSP